MIDEKEKTSDRQSEGRSNSAWIDSIISPIDNKINLVALKELSDKYEIKIQEEKLVKFIFFNMEFLDQKDLDAYESLATDEVKKIWNKTMGILDDPDNQIWDFGIVYPNREDYTLDIFKEYLIGQFSTAVIADKRKQDKLLSMIIKAQDVEIIERDHIVDNFLTKGKITVLAAERGTGKTTFVGDFLLAAENGETFFGGKFTIKRPLKCLVVIAEGDAQDIREKTKPIYDKETYLLLDVLNNKLSPDEILETIEKAISEYEIECVIFDSFSLLASRSSKDSNSNNEAINIMDKYGLKVANMGVAVLMTMHTSFKTKKGEPRGIRGASAFEDLPSYVYYLEGVEDEFGIVIGTKLTHGKKRYGNYETPEFFGLTKDGRIKISSRVREISEMSNEDKDALIKEAKTNSKDSKLEEIYNELYIEGEYITMADIEEHFDKTRKQINNLIDGSTKFELLLIPGQGKTKYLHKI